MRDEASHKNPKKRKRNAAANACETSNPKTSKKVKSTKSEPSKEDEKHLDDIVELSTVDQPGSPPDRVSVEVKKTDDTNPVSAPAAPLEDHADAGEDSATKAQRFIVFIGNLPYGATTASITKHFSKVTPASVRHITDKDSKKSKGFAFLEFDSFDKMKTCLKLYHHSSFNDGTSPARKINVELTAGGGGAKSQVRRSKLQKKNDKLNEERKRRMQEQTKAKGKHATKETPKNSSKNERGKRTPKQPDTEDHESVHPSRRAQVTA